MLTGAKADDVDLVTPPHLLHEKECDARKTNEIQNLATANF
jgi:hypothetical protein